MVRIEANVTAVTEEVVGLIVNVIIKVSRHTRLMSK